MAEEKQHVRENDKILSEIVIPLLKEMHSSLGSNNVLTAEIKRDVENVREGFSRLNEDFRQHEKMEIHNYERVLEDLAKMQNHEKRIETIESDLKRISWGVIISLFSFITGSFAYFFKK